MTVIFDFNKKQTEEDTVARMLMDAEYKRLCLVHKPKGQQQKEELFKLAQQNLIKELYDIHNPVKEAEEKTEEPVEPNPENDTTDNT